MTQTLEQLIRAAEADKSGHCAICAYMTGELVKATQKAYQNDKWVNLCSHHAAQVRQERHDEVRKGGTK